MLKKDRIMESLGAFIALFFSWILCRFTLWDLHGNKDWPMVLFVIGLAVLGISAIKDKKKVMACTVIGYMGGFALGILFGADGVDPGGGRTNNWWQIWTLAYVAIIIAGVVWDVIARRIKK